MQTIIKEKCFKLHRSNAKAFINGFEKDGKLIHQTIYCEMLNKNFPMLITYYKHPAKFPLSKIGYDLNYDSSPLRIKYIADFVEEYFIENKIELWNTLCNNGLFDIWLPEAPYARFKDAKGDPSKYRIVLLRIYEIEEEFHASDIREANVRTDMIKDRSKLQVTIKKPVVDDTTFYNIKNLLEESINSYRSKQNKKSFPSDTHSESSYIDSSQTISERNLENIIVERLTDIEPGLKLIQRQLTVKPVGRIDILCSDQNNDFVVIELKKYDAPKSSVIDQITGYMGYVRKHLVKEGQKVRGIIICGQKDEKLIYSASAVNDLEVKTFRIIIE
ncbi:MAG: endonuclease NucS [Prolixibacteraceae bacterium]|jgi:hypothetical protein|nr:endonuclease NucS [Prolixibacteraceae bacterium]